MSEFSEVKKEQYSKNGKTYSIQPTKFLKDFLKRGRRLIYTDYKCNKNRFRTLLKYLFVCISFLIIYLLYFLSLEICSEGIDNCSVRFQWIELKIKEEVISCIFLVIMIQLIFFKVISMIHFIHIIIIFGSFLSYSHGYNFYDHGYFNFLYYCILLAIITTILIPLDYLIILCKNKKINLKLIIIFLLIIIFAFILFGTKGINCNDWPKGLNNSYIKNDESKYGCQIQIPKKCIYKNFEYIQDYSKLIGKDCKIYKNGINQKETLLKRSKSPYINKISNRIGYPLFNKDSLCFLDFPDYNNILSEFFFNNLVDMDNQEILNKFFKEKMPEVEIDFSNINNPKLIIINH